jgi:gluconokinase
MGVAGSGKSSLGAALAQSLGLPHIEGDDFHSPASRDKMRAGIALTDEDRAGWLDRLAQELATRGAGAVLSCSALKRAYRDRLRAGAPGVRFVFLDIPESVALQRVAARASQHLFPPSLVPSQFAALERPTAEDDVLVLDGSLPVARLAKLAKQWLQGQEARP